MNKEYWSRIFGISPNDKVVYYKNPNECNKFNIERVNPDHVAIIWGQRKNKMRNWIKLGKIYFGSILTSFFDYVRIFFEWFNKNYDVCMFAYYIIIAFVVYAIVLNIPIIEGVLCIGRYR